MTGKAEHASTFTAGPLQPCLCESHAVPTPLCETCARANLSAPQNPDCSILMPRRACPEVPNHPIASFADQLHVGAWVAKKHVGRGPKFWRGTLQVGVRSIYTAMPIVSGEVQSTHGSQLQDHVSYVQGLGHVRHCLALAQTVPNLSE